MPFAREWRPVPPFLLHQPGPNSLWDDGAVQRQRVFRLTAGAIMGASAVAAAAPGFREPPTLWQVLCLVLAACLTAGGTVDTCAPSALAISTNDRAIVGKAFKKSPSTVQSVRFGSDSGGVISRTA
jgi:hypothetical protein